MNEPTNGHRKHRRSVVAVVGLCVALSLAVGPGCARKYRAEKDGKKAGEALCDLRKATTAEESKEALSDLQNQIGDIVGKYAVFTAKDRADIEENVNDLAEHAAQGNTELAQQDLAVIRRSLANIKDDLGDTQQAAVDGFFEGMADCLDDAVDG